MKNRYNAHNRNKLFHGNVLNNTHLTYISDDNDFVGCLSNKYIKKIICLCVCGNIKSLYLCNILNGKTKSCGCLKLNKSIQRKKRKELLNEKVQEWYKMVCMALD